MTVISHSYWRRRFGAAPDVIGRTVRLNTVPFTIAGVMPPDFFGAEVGRANLSGVPPAFDSPALSGRESGAPLTLQLRGAGLHLKTAGTSYLEALRTIAAVDVDLFREIYLFARERFETDRASYHVSAELSRAPLPDQVADCRTLLNQSDARQILHIAFGSVLTGRATDGNFLFRDRLLSLLLMCRNPASLVI